MEKISISKIGSYLACSISWITNWIWLVTRPRIAYTCCRKSISVTNRSSDWARRC